MLDLSLCSGGRLVFCVAGCRVSLENLLLLVKEGCHSSPKDKMDVFLGLEGGSGQGSGI